MIEKEIKDGIYKIVKQSDQNTFHLEIQKYLLDNSIDDISNEKIKIFNIIDKNWDDIISKDHLYVLSFYDSKSIVFNLSSEHLSYRLEIRPIKDDYYLCLLSNDSIKNAHKVDYDKIIEYFLYIKENITKIVEIKKNLRIINESI